MSAAAGRRALHVSVAALPAVGYPIGGFVVVYEYANRLAARGHRVTILHGWVPREVAARYGVGPPPAAVSQDTSWFDFHPGVSVVHVPEHAAELLPDADVLVNGTEIPGRLDRHGLDVLFMQGLGFVPRSEAWCIRAARRIVCVSNWVVEGVVAHGRGREDVVLVPNGLDHGAFRLMRPIERRPWRVAMLYNSAHVKGADVGVAALERVRGEVADVSAVFFGTEERPAIPDWIEYERLPSRAHLAERIYNGASVLVCPSRAEGFYLCGPEAMACGCALATTDVGGPRDYAEHERTALVSPVEDPGALAVSVVRLLRDEALRVRIAEAGRRRVEAFSWDRSVDLLEGHFLRWTTP